MNISSKRGVGGSPSQQKPSAMPNRSDGLASKKQATSPMVYNMDVKRPKMMGGFIDDTDEDSDEKVDSGDEDDSRKEDEQPQRDQDQRDDKVSIPIKSSSQRALANSRKSLPGPKSKSRSLKDVPSASRNPRINPEPKATTAHHVPIDGRKTILKPGCTSKYATQSSLGSSHARNDTPQVKVAKRISLQKLRALMGIEPGASKAPSRLPGKGDVAGNPLTPWNQTHAPARTVGHLSSITPEKFEGSESSTQPIPRSNDHAGQSKVQVAATRTPMAPRGDSAHAIMPISSPKKSTPILNTLIEPSASCPTLFASSSKTPLERSAHATKPSPPPRAAGNHNNATICEKTLSEQPLLAKVNGNTASVQCSTTSILGGLMQDIRLGRQDENVTNQEPVSTPHKSGDFPNKSHNHVSSQTIESKAQDQSAQNTLNKLSAAPSRKRPLTRHQTPRPTTQHTQPSDLTPDTLEHRLEKSSGKPLVQRRPTGNVASGPNEAPRPDKRKATTPAPAISTHTQKALKLIDRRTTPIDTASNPNTTSQVSSVTAVPSSKAISIVQSSSQVPVRNVLKQKDPTTGAFDQQSKDAAQLSPSKTTVVKQQVHRSNLRQSSTAVNTKQVGTQSTPTHALATRKTSVDVKIPTRKVYAAPIAVMVPPTTLRSSETISPQSGNQSNSRCQPTDTAVATSSKKSLEIHQEPTCAVPAQKVTLRSASDVALVVQPMAVISAFKPSTDEAPMHKPLTTKTQQAKKRAGSNTFSEDASCSTGIKNANPDVWPKATRPVRPSVEDITHCKVELVTYQTQTDEENKALGAFDKPVDAEADREANPTPDTLRTIPLASRKINTPKELPSKVTSQATPSPKVAIIPREQQADANSQKPAPVLAISTSPTLPADAVPFFEYSIFQKIWSESQSEASVSAKEFCSRPYTNIDEANAQAETFFKNAREQYQSFFQVRFGEWSSKPDDHGCEIFTGTFAPLDMPSKKIGMKVWVQRDYVSAYAGGTESAMQHTSFVAKTIYTLRLFELAALSADDQSDNPPSTRVYHALPRTECYTTLAAANRAAKSLQIELSHEKSGNAMTKMWQAAEAAKLDKKLLDLETAQDEEAQYWKSEFNGCGLGSKRFELVVEKVGLCGPRNL
jgi:hypothetical protein